MGPFERPVPGLKQQKAGGDLLVRYKWVRFAPQTARRDPVITRSLESSRLI
jgi:hypothetical protein